MLELAADVDLSAEASLSLFGAASSAEATLVDHVQRADGRKVALLVVRSAEPFEVTGFRIAELEVQASGRWPEVSSKRPGN